MPFDIVTSHGKYHEITTSLYHVNCIFLRHTLPRYADKLSIVCIACRCRASDKFPPLILCIVDDAHWSENIELLCSRFTALSTKNVFGSAFIDLRKTECGANGELWNVKLLLASFALCLPFYVIFLMNLRINRIYFSQLLV